MECRELDAPELAVWNEVAECMEIDELLPAPTVVIVNAHSFDCGEVKSSACHTSGFIGFSPGKSDILAEPVIWRHEFTHEILYLVTGNQDRYHKSEWFVTG